MKVKLNLCASGNVSPIFSVFSYRCFWKVLRVNLLRRKFVVWKKKTPHTLELYTLVCRFCIVIYFERRVFGCSKEILLAGFSPYENFSLRTQKFIRALALNYVINVHLFEKVFWSKNLIHFADRSTFKKYITRVYHVSIFWKVYFL